MRIAVASDGLNVASHLSQCENFNYYSTKSCEIVDSQNLPAQGTTVEDYAHMLTVIDAGILLVNHATPQECQVFADKDITVVSGASGNAFAAAQDYLDGKLN